MRRATSFATKALAGYFMVTFVLAGGMALTIQGLGDIATRQMASARAEENEITIAERLRWRGELIVSNGRGYLLSGDADLHATLRANQSDFGREARSLMKPTLSPTGASLVTDVQRNAESYQRVLNELVARRQRVDSSPTLVQRFETELFPLRRRLGESLDRLVDHKEHAIENVYEDAQRERARLKSRMYTLLGILLVVGFGIALYSASLLGRAFRQEHDALEMARKALAARDEIMGVVAHDLRNPLYAITMNAALLREGIGAEDTQKRAASIENIAMRMEHLIKSMLDVATIEAGRFSVTPAPCDPKDLLRETMDMFENLAGQKQIRFEQAVTEPAGSIRADRERLLQVLSNLVGNAFKFTPQGGHVTISAVREGEVVRFGVSDTGPGISGEHVPHLFERFWKQETSGKKGTGLGLFIAKGIIEAHGGKIWAESQPGHGATFHFTIPAASENAAPQRIETGGSPAHA